LQRLRQIDLVQIVVQRAHLLLCRAAAAHALPKVRKRPLYACSQFVHGCEPRSRLVCPVRTVAVRVRGPGHFARPRRTANFPFERVVFKEVALLHREARKPRFEAAEHILIFKSARRRVERTEQQRQDAALQNVAPVGIIERDPKAREHRLQCVGIALQVPRRDRHVAVAVALLAHEL